MFLFVTTSQTRVLCSNGEGCTRKHLVHAGLVEDICRMERNRTCKSNGVLPKRIHVFGKSEWSVGSDC